MPIFASGKNSLETLKEMRFSDFGMTERGELQRSLRN